MIVIQLQLQCCSKAEGAQQMGGKPALLLKCCKASVVVQRVYAPASRPEPSSWHYTWSNAHQTKHGANVGKGRAGKKVVIGCSGQIGRGRVPGLAALANTISYPP